MKLTYPYEIEIMTKEEAVDYIKHQCDNCPRYKGNWDCSGAMAKKCQNAINLIITKFSGK